jgi:hypothetical protein
VHPQAIGWEPSTRHFLNVFPYRFHKYKGFSLYKFDFDLIVLKAIGLLKHSPIGSWNQPVLSNGCKVSCSRKQRLAPDGQHEIPKYTQIHPNIPKYCPNISKYCLNIPKYCPIILKINVLY